ncbi:MAG: acetyl-CoA carboxylase biotin carboxyl carrier protein subunit [Alphaproteobacteria bacterium]|nr:acetyl-CoA carboxylase biotin carboxyl carrier protein subunit [Alphaproteobacteria bacterium]
MKKLRITVENRSYDVTVEELEDTSARPSALPTQVPRPFISVVNPAPAAAPAPRAAAPAPRPAAASAAPPVAAGAGSVLSPLAGVIVSVDVAVGQAVKEGDKLLCLEAMKMNTDVLAPHAGTVTAVHVDVGVPVQESQVLVTVS